MFPNDFQKGRFIMNLKKSFLLYCAISAYVVLQIGVYWGIVKAQTPDPCPNYITKTSTPCPFPEGATLYDNCSQSSNCTGYTAYSADTLNTDAELQEGSESWTTSTTYESPVGYQCATYTMCIRNLATEICEAREKTKMEFGKLYTAHSCNE
jgi:hypothetical protein